VERAAPIEFDEPVFPSRGERVPRVDLAEIQRAVEALPKDQQAALAAWLSERDQAEWDGEIEGDFSPRGAGMALLQEMKADARAGRFRSLSKVGRRGASDDAREWPSSPSCLRGSGSSKRVACLSAAPG
jgi:hypothetical protein